jgi:chorismate-pyruvate lyase
MIREALLQRPFRPFRIRLADGRALEVRSPERLAVSSRQLVLISGDDEAVTWIEPQHVVTLDFSGGEHLANGKPHNAGGPELETLLGLFPRPDYVQSAQEVAGEDVPEPYHHLLVHEHHMTVTVEAHYGSLVDVRILERKQDEATYARRIVLALRNTGQIVLFGIVRIRLEFCSSPVRDAILAGDTPLGRILINHGVLRRIEPTAFLRIVPGPEMMRCFGLSEPQPTYGRLAIIHCDRRPAIELLEIVTPPQNRIE